GTQLLRHIVEQHQRLLYSGAGSKALLTNISRPEQRKLETLWSLSSPPSNRAGPGNRAMRLLDINKVVLLKVSGCGNRKTCTSDRDHLRNNLLALRRSVRHPSNWTNSATPTGPAFAVHRFACRVEGCPCKTRS